MSDTSIVTQLPLLPDSLWPPKKAVKPRDLHTFWQHPEQSPAFITNCPTARRYLDLLGPLRWTDFPERNLQRDWDQPTIPFSALAAAQLIRLAESHSSFHQLHVFLEEHPSLIWLLGFPLTPAPHTALGFNARASLPTPRHLPRLLHRVSNAALQFLLADSVRLILAKLQKLELAAPECISLDTKHILAWVK
jgi:hypothetical protein